LFVVRVAGNIVAPSLIGSIEFAAVTFDTQLIVVMGHSNCGAVLATVESIQKPSTPYSENIRDIVDRIRPGVVELIDPALSQNQILEKAVRTNIRTSCSHLRHGSRLLESLTIKGKVTIVGAEFSLETGLVRFLD
jgi:carbonic anhydrase